MPGQGAANRIMHFPLYGSWCGVFLKSTYQNTVTHTRPYPVYLSNPHFSNPITFDLFSPSEFALFMAFIHSQIQIVHIYSCLKGWIDNLVVRLRLPWWSELSCHIACPLTQVMEKATQGLAYSWQDIIVSWKKTEAFFKKLILYLINYRIKLNKKQI